MYVIILYSVNFSWYKFSAKRPKDNILWEKFHELSCHHFSCLGNTKSCKKIANAVQFAKNCFAKISHYIVPQPALYMYMNDYCMLLSCDIVHPWDGFIIKSNTEYSVPKICMWAVCDVPHCLSVTCAKYLLRARRPCSRDLWQGSSEYEYGSQRNVTDITTTQNSFWRVQIDQKTWSQT